MNRNSKYGVDGRNLFGKQYPGPSKMTDKQACRLFGHKPMQAGFQNTFCKQCFVDLIRSADGSFQPAVAQETPCQP
jgi:hypothetical protein